MSGNLLARAFFDNGMTFAMFNVKVVNRRTIKTVSHAQAPHRNY
jgi:hypothetical protein